MSENSGVCNLLERIDEQFDKFENFLNGLFTKLLDIDFADGSLEKLRDDYSAPAQTEIFYDHAVRLMESDSNFAKELTATLGDEIDRIRQADEGIRDSLFTCNYYARFDDGDWIGCFDDSAMYNECQNRVRKLAERYIVLSPFKTVRAFLILAKLQEKLEINTNLPKTKLKQIKTAGFGRMFYTINLQKCNPNADFPETLTVSADGAEYLYNAYHETVKASLKTFS